jgi:mRNA interferase RelE/StbE
MGKKITKQYILTITKQNTTIYKVVLTKDAVKYLAKMPSGLALKVTRAIRGIAIGDQNPAKTSKLSGRDVWRLRVGGLRVIYILDEESSILTVIKIGPRGDVYK